MLGEWPGELVLISIFSLWVHSYLFLVPSKSDCLEVSDVDGGDLKIRVSPQPNTLLMCFRLTGTWRPRPVHPNNTYSTIPWTFSPVRTVILLTALSPCPRLIASQDRHLARTLRSTRLT